LAEDGTSRPGMATPPTPREPAPLIAARLREAAPALKAEWEADAPHARAFVLDDLLPDNLARDINGAFPGDGPFWRRLDTFRERKKTFAKLDRLDPAIATITDAFHDAEVIGAVSEITGIDGLEADPTLYAGGVSMMETGDFLNPHLDNSHDAGRRRYRRLNLLYYVTPGWTRDHGGNFELWDRTVTTPREIVSRFNRLVVMETNRASWHSVNPVRAAEPRRCVSNYYFSVRSPDGGEYYHVTSFLGRPGQLGRRLWGRLDNAMRQTVASLLKISRGKHLGRDRPD